MTISVLLLLLFGGQSRIFAQNDSLKTEADSAKVRRMRWLGMPVVYYTPETRWAFGAGAVLTFRFPREPLESKPSQAQLALVYTLNRQILIYMPYRLLWNNEAWLATGEAGYYRFNYYFYGVGNYPDHYERELYDVNFPRIQLNLMRRVRPGLYVGLRYAFDNFDMVATAPGGQLSSGLIYGSEGGVMSEFGLAANYDSRDNIFWPSKGEFLKAEAVFNAPWTGSDYSWTRLTIDGSKFFGLPWGHILATNARVEFETGNPPFFQLAMLGGPKRMRGYYEGQFRDRQLLLLQTEYRAHLFWRCGLVAFFNYGMVARSIPDFDLRNSRCTYGFGGRLRIDKKELVHVRADVGFGKYGSGFYLTFGEAF